MTVESNKDMNRDGLIQDLKSALQAKKNGADTFTVIENDIQMLIEIEGIGKKRIRQIAESWQKQKEVKNIMLFLQEHDVSTAFAAKIYKQYGSESIEKVRENPYRLADDIWGIGFKTADGIAELPEAREKTGNQKLSVDVRKIQQAVHMEYDEIQAGAIRLAASAKVMVLTGGPGTGKTTTTQGIIAAFRAYGLKILLAASTGRAAKRLSETTGMKAETIHRLLGCRPPEGYQRNGKNPLEGDVLVVDECFMIDIILMNSLLKAVPESMPSLRWGRPCACSSWGTPTSSRLSAPGTCFVTLLVPGYFLRSG